MIRWQFHQGSLTEGVRSVRLTSLHWLVKILFKLKLLFAFLTKTNITEEVNCTEPSSSVNTPLSYISAIVGVYVNATLT